jgi:Mrp family chromosome partitioning ATPase
MKHNVIKQLLTDVAWGQLDYLVVDSPPGTGDEPLAVVQQVGSPAGAVIVTTPQELAISDVRRCVGFCRTVSLPIIGIIENMSGFVCPHCSQRIDLFKSGGGKTLALEMKVPFLGSIPIDPQIVSSGDAGAPLISGCVQSETGKVFSGISETIMRNSLV